MSRHLPPRKLVGYLRGCGDPNCTCVEAVIEERWVIDNVPHTEDFWLGDWHAEWPSPEWEEMMRQDLAEACTRHRMTEREDEPGVWEREL